MWIAVSGIHGYWAVPCSACNKGLEEGSAGASCAVGAPESNFASCVEIKEPSTNPASPDRAV